VGSARRMHGRVRYVDAEIYLSRYRGAINTLVYIGVYLNAVLRTRPTSAERAFTSVSYRRGDKHVSSNSTKKTAIVSGRSGRKRNTQRPAGA